MRYFIAKKITEKKLIITTSIISVILVVFVLFSLNSVFSEPALDTRPNIIVIYTDDQRPETLDYMPTVQERLAGEGITFTNSFVTTPLCCPGRASVLTGLYTHRHGVWNNKSPIGGVEKLNDSSTLATWLQAAGYTTSLIGKYLNGYSEISPYIPPGWNDWHVFPRTKYYDFRLNENGVINRFLENEYATDVLKDKAVNFIQNANRPFFLWFTPNAPHSAGDYPTPPIPASRHVGTCENLSLHRPSSFNEADVSDKPAWVQETALLDEGQIAESDTFRKEQICSLKAIDEAVASILDVLGPELDNTVVIFTSDNGLLWGEHRIAGKKNCIYEECARVPLTIRYPPLVVSPRVSDKLVLNIDLAPTIAELAEASVPIEVDGKSLVAILSDENTDWRTDFLLEYFKGETSPNPNFAVRNTQFKYVELGTGEKELYDLVNDPYELDNAINNPAHADTINQLAQRLVQLSGVQRVSPLKGFGKIANGTKVTDYFKSSEVATEDCDAGTCSSANSWNFGFDSDIPVKVRTRIVFSYDLSSLGINGSQITSLKFSLGGCWHGGNGRSCNNADNPGFDSTQGKAIFSIWNGTKWERLGARVNLGTYLSSTADDYGIYAVSKLSGFSDSYLQNGIIKVRINTTGTTTDGLDVQQVTDFATITITYNPIGPSSDLNKDGKVNSQDIIAIILSSWGRSSS